MNNKSEKFAANVINDPGKVYKVPGSIVTDVRLTPNEKDKILCSWEQDQLALMRAEDESMIQRDNTAPAVDTLKKVKEAEQELEASASPVTKSLPA